MDKLINILKKNAKDHLKIGVIASLILFIIFFILQYNKSILLSLDNKWIAVALLPIVLSLLFSGKISEVKILGVELKVESSKINLDNANEKIEYTVNEERPILPSDYFYLNHTSFYRKDKQNELQEKAGLRNYKLYDIRVKVYSYYSGAIEKVERVEYYLHSSYEKSKQASTDLKNNFELKELAYGEYVLSAKIFMKDNEYPFILQRYISLWETGPKI